MFRCILFCLIVCFSVYGCKTTGGAKLKDSSIASASAKTCKAGPVMLKSGESFPSRDGCNRCSCYSGNFGCTELACPGNNPPEGCEVGLMVLPYGTSIASSDGCNTCSCSKNGLACTELACGGSSESVEKRCLLNGIYLNDGDRYPSIDGCNTCSCRGGHMPCTELACPNATPPKGCKVGLIVLPLNATVKSSDGCNTCTCDEYGLACTEMFCGNGNQGSVNNGEKKSVEVIELCQQEEGDQWVEAGIAMNDGPGLVGLVVKHNVDDNSAKLVFNKRVTKEAKNGETMYRDANDTFKLRIYKKEGTPYCQLSLLSDGPGGIMQDGMYHYTNETISHD